MDLGSLITPFLEGAALLGDGTFLLILLIAVLYGTLAGALPGVGTPLAYGLVLPFTYGMTPVEAVGLLMAIAVGINYGNSIPAILIAVPGTAAAVLTALDGYSLHKDGKSGLALGTAFVAAVAAQIASIPVFVLLVVPLSGLAYIFLSPELFSLYLFGMVAIVSLTGKNLLKGLAAAGFGLSIALAGIDPINNTERFVLVPEMRTGLDVNPLIIGLLAVSELFRQSRQTFSWDSLGTAFSAKFPRFSELRPAIPAIAIGTVIGTLVSAIPGTGATPAALISYQQAKIMSKEPEKFGVGSLEGLAANEAAQNASNSGDLIPTLGLGIPGSSSMVLLLGALQVQGIVPGPLLIRETPELLYAGVAGLLGGALFLIVTGWWMARLMLKIVTMDRQIIIVGALALIVLGVYSLRMSTFDVVVCLAMGAVGYFMTRYGYSTAAAALAIVLGAGFERYLRIGLGLYDGDIASFLLRPVTLVIVVLAAVFLAIGVKRTFRAESPNVAERANPQDRARS